MLFFSQFLSVHLTYLRINSQLRSSLNWFYCSGYFPYVLTYVIILLEFLSLIDHKTYASESNMIIILLFN